MAAEIKARLEPGTGGVYTRVIPHLLSPVASGSREKSKSISTTRPSRKAIASSFAATTLPRPKPRKSFSTRSGGPKFQGFICRIIEIANERGGPDNSTGVAIFVDRFQWNRTDSNRPLPQCHCNFLIDNQFLTKNRKNHTFSLLDLFQLVMLGIYETTQETESQNSPSEAKVRRRFRDNS